MNGMPVIDGHFWVERDGKIIDWDFEEYCNVRKMWGCGKEKKYLPAPEITQKIMIGIFKKKMMEIFEINNWEDCVAEFYKLSVIIGLKPTFDRCFQNCLMEIHERGGELVFGSLGFKKPDGSFHYEYGGENYLTIKDFRKF